MTERTFDYYGARICIYNKYENGDVDAKIFPDKDDFPFTRVVFSKKAYEKILDAIKKSKLKGKTIGAN